MNFVVTREPTVDDGTSHIDWLVDSFVRRCKMTERETAIVKLIVVEGVLDRTDLGDRLDVCKATVKWHLHNVFEKSGTRNQVTLLRAAFGLSTAAAVPKCTADDVDDAPERSTSVPSKSWF